jgi:glycosyltransferase involved in cell wall biosynthesis
LISSYSIICPVYNESAYLPELLSFLSQCLPEPSQIFLIDGGSIDNSREIILQWKENLPQLQLIFNPYRTVPYALNLAIPMCNADIIVRIDAHTKYAKDYFGKILETFNNTAADIVGGPTRTSFKEPFQESVAYVFNTPFGMGNSSVHDVAFNGYTDSVTFGAWKTELFRKTGLFDVRFKRNQDDEFHYRARSLGFKIFQNSDIKLWYYPRNNIKALFRQYYEYGLYKPLVLQKNKSGLSIRHLVPSLFVLYLLSLCVLFNWSWLVSIPLISYFIIALFFALKAESSISARFHIPLVYPIIHMGYGIGFIFGLRKLFI